METSSMRGNFTSTFFQPRNSIFSRMVRSHAMWLYRPSTETPTSSVLYLRNSSAMTAKVMNSEVHTGVKSAGCEKRMDHLPL